MESNNKHLNNIVIVGGGSAGWMAAAALAKTVNPQFTQITLVESATIGTVGVGEATIPPILNFLKYLGIDEADFMKHTQASYKLGIKFTDWHTLGESYMHPFGSIGVRINGNEFYPCWHKAKLNGDPTSLTDYSPAAVMCEHNKYYPPQRANKDSFIAGASYALHFDATLMAKYLRRFAEKLGVKRIEDDVCHVNVGDNGFIQSLDLEKNGNLEGDFFIDCTGFKGLLIEDALHAGYEDWSDFLPCDRAIAVQTENIGPTPPYTLSAAKDAGWVWRIPLQHRTGNGYVYCSKYCTDEQALQTLLNSVKGELVTEPRVISFVTGKRKKIWSKNCLALGLSSGFIEPLESTALHLVTRGLRAFLDMMPSIDCEPVIAEEYNRIMTQEYESIRDFIVLHYCATARKDTPFWRHCQSMEIPPALENKIALYQSRGLLYYNPTDLFKEPSWYCVFEGMGVRPKAYDPIVDYMDYEQVQSILKQVRELMQTMASGLPSHDEFLQNFCPANKHSR